MKGKITQEELKRILHYNSETGVFTWKVSNSNNIKIGDIAGCKRKDGYIIIRINNIDYLAHRLAWLYMEGYLPENKVDHIYRVEDDNRWVNLRIVSDQCSVRNRGEFKNNTSGVTGVSWYKGTNKWLAKITINYKIIHLGYFENINDAVLARWNAEVKYDFSNCNTTSSAYNYLKKKKV